MRLRKQTQLGMRSGARTSRTKKKLSPLPRITGFSNLHSFMVVLMVCMAAGISYHLTGGFGKKAAGGASSRGRRAQRVPSPDCEDRHDRYECAQYANSGGCTTHPGWMAVFCAATCDMCELLDPAVRCDPKHLNMSMEPLMAEGDIDEMFKRLDKKFPEYSINYLSSPPGPWILRFNNFVTDEEVDALLRHTKDKLERSTGQGSFDENGVQEKLVINDRTSTNAWCDDNCMTDPQVAQIVKKISRVTGAPTDNFESFQALRYEPGQFYSIHHDMNPEDVRSASGARVLTFFIYLSDVIEGGGTNFPYAPSTVGGAVSATAGGGDMGKGVGGVTAHPIKGSALLWPSVHSDHPDKQLREAYHQALPVKRGLKYAANAWIHQRSYVVPNRWGCTGSFDDG